MKSDLHDVKAIFQVQTPKAVCIKASEDGADIWMPKSMCEFEPEEPRRGDLVTITAKESFLTEKGLADN